MFGIGFTEMALILVVALIFVGPEKLPEMARALGKAYSELRRAGEDIKRSVAGVEEVGRAAAGFGLGSKAGPRASERAESDEGAEEAEEDAPAPAPAPKRPARKGRGRKRKS